MNPTNENPPTDPATPPTVNPAVANPAAANPAAPNLEANPAHPPPILLVEDNPMDVELTLRAFRRRRLTNRVEIARDGEEALAWLPRWEAGEPRPAVILLDLKLPRVDGLEVLRRLKGHAEFRSIPVVVLTTSAESRDVREAYAIGANSYIVKPVDFDKFVEMAAQIEIYWTVVNQRCI